ncbi:uncharacterized protein LOC113509528 [Galleria mellonella]|uniref:Uncharacterized protein LOC113509528 n=1 Tax=Galleria mellonella TaxID=7137 RepID=A0A6J1WE48_GALME|nr:uncharacterized protein LOC113509528 [Galleria mellonella]
MALWTPYIEDCPLDLSKTRNNEIIPAVLEKPSSTDATSFNHMDFACKGYRFPDPVPVVQHVVPRKQTGHSYYLVDYSHISTNSVSTSPELLELRRCDSELLSDDPEYIEFEKDALRVMAERNGGMLIGQNPKMKRTVQTNEAADEAYRIQRQRNNLAAKQSRDRRKMRELRLSLKVTYLKKKVAEMKAMLATNPCKNCLERSRSVNF